MVKRYRSQGEAEATALYLLAIGWLDAESRPMGKGYTVVGQQEVEGELLSMCTDGVMRAVPTGE